MVQKKTGRPRSFDTGEALDRIQAVFWRYGYEGAALSELADATGLFKPSLYAAFGDKRRQYLSALDLYISESGKLVERALSAASVSQALRSFFKSDLDVFLAEDGRGCFLVATAIPIAGMDPEVADRTRKALDGLRTALRFRLLQAKEQREIGEKIDLDLWTDQLFSLHLSLAVQARAGSKRKHLQREVDRLLESFEKNLR